MITARDVGFAVPSPSSLLERSGVLALKRGASSESVRDALERLSAAIRAEHLSEIDRAATVREAQKVIVMTGVDTTEVVLGALRRT